MVDYGGERLVINFSPGFPDFERKVGVLVVSRSVARIKATQLVEKRLRDEKAGARTVINLAQIVILRLIRMITLPEIDSRSVSPHDPARFLQAAIGINQFRTDQSRVGPLIEDTKERRQPVFGNLGIIVEEEKVLAPSTGGGGIATVEEPEVRVVGKNTNPFHLTQAMGGPGRGIVINDDYFIGYLAGILQDRLKTIEGYFRLVENRDKD